MKNYTVYMHISPSGKRYIGITSKSVNQRWNNGNGYKGQIFYNAINKYGWGNIEHIIVAKGLDKETAEWLEIELIRELDTTNPSKGYNVTKGGNASDGLFGELNPFYGKHHTEEAKQKNREAHLGMNMGSDNCNAESVVCLNTKKIFGSMSEGAEHYNIKGSSDIGVVCRKERKSCGKLADGTKLVWRYYEDYLKMTEEEINEAIKEGAESKLGKNHGRARAVICLNILEIFSTAKEGAEYCGLSSSSNIINCCKGYVMCKGKIKVVTHCGKHPITGEPLRWKYYDEYLKEQEQLEVV